MTQDTIAIVDDDEAVRLSTSQLLRGWGFGATLFKSGDDFIARPLVESVSCILLDLQMPGSDGLAVMRVLGERGESPPVVVITAHGGIGAAIDAMKLGAHDFIEKPYDATKLLAVIRKVLESSSDKQDARARRRDAAALVETLTHRQRQVLLGILNGRPNKIIAYELGLSIRTIEAYRSQLLAKLGVRGTADAVRIAMAAGLAENKPVPARATAQGLIG